MSWTSHARERRLLSQLEGVRSIEDAPKLEYDICPCGKRCMSRKEAYSSIAHAKAQNHFRHMKHIPKRVYFCPFCGTYHTTSETRKEYRERSGGVQ